MKKIVLLWCMLLASLNGYCWLNEVFTTNCNGLDMTFIIISDNEVSVFNNYQSTSNNHSAIDWNFEGKVVIPEEVEHGGKTYQVTRIGTSSFNDCHMDTLILPSTLKKIENFAIQSCHHLYEITIPASVTEIEEGAFPYNSFYFINVEDGNANYCTVDNVLFTKDMKTLLHYPLGRSLSAHYTSPQTNTYEIPNTVTRIGENAFNNSYLDGITIPSSVTEIGDDAFYQCHYLPNLFIPASVTTLGLSACTGDSKITDFEVDANNPAYKAIDGVIYNKQETVLIGYPNIAPRTSYTIPYGTEEISQSAFGSAKYLEEIIIPNTVTKIGRTALLGCRKLRSLDVPASVTELGGQAFDYCDSLTSVYMHSLTPPTINPSYASCVFGGNTNLRVYVPYQSFEAYSNAGHYTRLHIDPAIDCHDNHWTWVMTCVVGVDFTKSPGVDGFIVCENNSGNNAKSLQVKKIPDPSKSSLKLVKVDKAGPGECVILKVEKPGKVYGLTADETAESHDDNLLVGVTATSAVSSTQGSNTNYIFDGEKFVEISSSESVSGGLGYLKIPTEMAQALGENIGVEKLLTEYSVFDAQDNTALLSSHHDEFANVNFDSRTLYKDGKWNTICVPFDLPITGSILDGGIARTLADASISGTTLTLTFGDPVDTLKAGVPYLIKWESGDDIVDPTFSCVTIQEDCHPVVFGEGEGTVKFIGTYAPVALEKNTTKNLYLGSNNKLYYPTVDNFYVNAFRAYFQLGSEMANAHQFVVDFGDEKTITGIFIEEIEQKTANHLMYNLAGQRVDNGYQGIVIIDGKKIRK